MMIFLGRVQLNLFVCCPFGDYEIDLDVESFSDEGSTLEQRTAWEIENGPDEVLIDAENRYTRNQAKDGGYVNRNERNSLAHHTVQLVHNSHCVLTGPYLKAFATRLL